MQKQLKITLTPLYSPSADEDYKELLKAKTTVHFVDIPEHLKKGSMSDFIHDQEVVFCNAMSEMYINTGSDEEQLDWSCNSEVVECIEGKKDSVKLEITGDSINAAYNSYERPKFGSFTWLRAQSGYNSLSKLIKQDASVKVALKDLLFESIKEYEELKNGVTQTD